MADDPSLVITQNFPTSPYNFDVAPSPYLIGPLKSIFKAVGQAIVDMQARALALQQQITVQTATGVYLDQHGKLYGVIRASGESDVSYRARILAVLHAGKLTLAAIKAAVIAYYAVVNAPENQPTVDVFDLRSNPVQAAADGLVLLDFEVSIAFTYPSTSFWIMGEAILGEDDGLDPATYFESATTRFVESLDPALDLVLQGVKASGTHPVYKNTTIYLDE